MVSSPEITYYNLSKEEFLTLLFGPRPEDSEIPGDGEIVEPFGLFVNCEN